MSRATSQNVNRRCLGSASDSARTRVSATRETRIAMGLKVLENAIAFFDGAEPPNRVV